MAAPSKMRKEQVALLLLCILSSVSAQSSDERMALLELKKSFSDSNGILDSWNGGSWNYCSWFGVSCNPDFRVSELTIGGNFSRSPSCSIESDTALHDFGIGRNCFDRSERDGILGGRLSSFIGNLTELTVLSLSFNEIGGEIPVEMWGLRNLRVLDLEGNDFVGHFSGFQFSGMRKLSVLNLAYNMISGMFPSSLAECTSLRILNLAGNRISDVVPGFVRGFKNLRVVNLSFNRLVGYIPSNFDCGNLEHLDLSYNFLKGGIPRDLGNCNRLRTILLSSNALRGVIPNELGNLQNLEVLNVARNGFRGPLPANLGNCTRLAVLVLSGHFNALRVTRSPRGRAPHRLSGAISDDRNSFKGSILDEIAALPQLKVLWAPNVDFEGVIPRNWGSCESISMVNLAQNLFTGEIFGLFGGCNDLHYLNLSFNRLTGRLDKKLQSSCTRMLDFSGNPLSGPTPSLDTSFCRHPYNPSVAYMSLLQKMAHEVQIMGNDGLSHDVLRLTSASVLVPLLAETKKKDHGLSTLAVGGMASALIAVAVALVLLALVLLALFCCGKEEEVKATIELTALPQTEKVILFSDIGVPLTYDSIVEATENFNRRNCIGTGGFGKTYRAEIAPGRYVAVKRLTAERHQGAAQFHAEVRTLGQINHPRLITLLGYYASGPEMMLIYNYLPGGNLDRFIQDRERNYPVIHKIASHVASALWYLHEQCIPRVLHRDIKPSNILLDDECNAYLADFGLSKILLASETDTKTRVAGTYGYISPEYALTGMVSDKADVYSYGVVLLELLSKMRALDPSLYLHQEGYNIVSWARMLLDRGNAEEVFAAGLWDEGPRDMLVRMLDVAVQCTGDVVAARLSMRQVVERLSQIQPL